MTRYYLALIFLLSIFPVSGVYALDKNSNYKDFTSWYEARHKVESVPFRAAAVVEAGSLEPLYFHQETTVIPTASLIKLLTAGALVKLPVDWWSKLSYSQADNETDLRQYVDAGDKFTLLKLQAGDSITAEHSLAAMLIGSANNAANHFASWLTSRSVYLESMRQVAKEWGMKHTTVDDPSGLSLGNTTTATDMANAICHATDNFMIQYYASRPSFTFVTANGEKKTVSHTVHQLRATPKSFFGAKTGYLRETGFHIAAGYITPKGNRICAAILSTETRPISEKALVEIGQWVDEVYN